MGRVRDLADGYLDELIELDPNLATVLGVRGHGDRLTDYSPSGEEARVDVARTTLTQLDAVGEVEEADQNCAALLRDRLQTELAWFDAGEHLRALRIIASPVSGTREVFDLSPAQTDDDWAMLGRRMEAVPEALDRVEASLREGMRRGLFAAPRQAEACAKQAATWAGLDDAEPWFVSFAARAPEAVRAALARPAEAATAAYGILTRFLRDDYLAAATGTPDAVGRDRYVAGARRYLGAVVDVDDAYAYGWSEVERIEAEMAAVVDEILPGRSLADVYEHLDAHGEAVEGEAALLAQLQGLIDGAIEALDGTYFEIAGPVRQVEAVLAPPGSAAAAYYTTPSLDFSRPGQTWYPTLGRTRFPIWKDVSTWYHEGVPGHHLQLAGWVALGDQLTRYQRSEFISGDGEGWALYAERLMDELGFLGAPDRRLGYLDGQLLRATRVVVDIGMHCEMPIPTGQPFHPGERWTPELGREFLLGHGGPDRAFLESEWIRYLGWPGQAISYKLGERVWLAGREAARRARGAAFDLKAWHTDALALGPLGLADLATVLPTL
ncbi:MAG TPA: DUF885 domain-containing protein [Acidimicrobiales bacterium]